jgi:hypothetical protein
MVTLAQGDLADAKKFSWFFVFYQGLLGFYVAMMFAGLALVPATLAIIYAEAKRLRSATFYVTAGVVIATVCFGVVQVARGNLKISDVSFAPDRIAGIALVGLYLCVVGVIGGLVYWLIAGRSAGAWRAPAGGQPRPAGDFL